MPASLIYPPSARSIEVDYLRYSREDYERIRAGSLAKDMEEKWSLVWRDDALNICRSWTGAVIWRCRFAETGGGAELKEVLVSDEPPARHELEDVAAVWFLIGWLLLGELRREDLEALGEAGGSSSRGEAFGDWVRLMKRRLGAGGEALAEVPVLPGEQLAYFVELQRDFPDSMGIAWKLAELYRAEGPADLAEQALSRLADEGKSASWRSLWALTERAWLRSEAGRERQAADDLAEALRRADESRQVSEVLTAIKLRLQDRDRHGRGAMGVLARYGLFDAEDAVRNAPRPKFDPLVWGFLRLCVEDWKGAVSDLDARLAEDPADLVALKYRSLAHSQSGDVARARADLEALARFPSDPLVDFVRAATLARR